MSFLTDLQVQPSASPAERRSVLGALQRSDVFFRYLTQSSAYFVLALLLRDFPEYRRDFVLLSGWGLGLGLVMWWQGPWTRVPIQPGYWLFVAGAGLSWGWLRYSRRSRTVIAGPTVRRRAA